MDPTTASKDSLRWEIWRIFSWYCVASKSEEIDSISCTSFHQMLKDSKLLSSANEAATFFNSNNNNKNYHFTRNDIDRMFIKETRSQIDTDLIAPVPIPAPPTISDPNATMASPLQRLISSVENSRSGPSSFFSADDNSKLAAARNYIDAASQKTASFERHNSLVGSFNSDKMEFLLTSLNEDPNYANSIADSFIDETDLADLDSELSAIASQTLNDPDTPLGSPASKAISRRSHSLSVSQATNVFGFPDNNLPCSPVGSRKGSLPTTFSVTPKRLSVSESQDSAPLRSPSTASLARTPTVALLGMNASSSIGNLSVDVTNKEAVSSFSRGSVSTPKSASMSQSGSIHKRLSFEGFIDLLHRLALHIAESKKINVKIPPVDPDIMRLTYAETEELLPTVVASTTSDEIFNDVILKNILANALRWQRDQVQDDYLNNPQIQAVLIHFRPFFVKAYAAYATTGKSNFMTFYSFHLFCQEFHILSSEISYAELGVIFLRTKATCATYQNANVDPNAPYESVLATQTEIHHNRNKLTLSEFMYAVGRAAFVGLPKKFRVSAVNLVKGLFMHISQCILRPTTHTPQRGAAFYNSLQPTQLLLQKLFRDMWLADNKKQYLNPKQK